VDDWLACEECHGLIETDNRTGLARRPLTAPGLSNGGWIPGRLRLSTAATFTTDSGKRGVGRHFRLRREG
jgi:hypothetical protein